MCGRFSLKTSPDTLERIFGHPAPPGYRARYNVAPSQQVLAVVADAGAERTEMLRWGLIPFWAKDASIGSRMINARAESVAEKPAYRSAFRKRRCIILADGFYEWQKRPDGKHPLWIRAPSGEPFAFAGLWERWDRGEQPIVSCTIITTEANSFMRPVHTRMPVILKEEEVWRSWLSEAAAEPDLLELLDRAREIDLQAHEVSTLVNNPANDLPECIDAVDGDSELLPLADLN